MWITGSVIDHTCKVELSEPERRFYKPLEMGYSVLACALAAIVIGGAQGQTAPNGFAYPNSPLARNALRSITTHHCADYSSHCITSTVSRDLCYGHRVDPHVWHETCSISLALISVLFYCAQGSQSCSTNCFSMRSKFANCTASACTDEDMIRPRSWNSRVKAREPLQADHPRVRHAKCQPSPSC